MPKQPPKKRCSTPSRSTRWAARKRISAWAVVRRSVRGGGASRASGSSPAVLASATLCAERLVEGVDVRLRVRGRALEHHPERALRVRVAELVGTFLVPAVDEDLVRILVEERTPVDE